MSAISEDRGIKLDSIKIKTLDNKNFNNYDCGGFDKSVVKGQFSNGCADPYIYRYNGYYYLYITTSGLTNFGLRAWKSKDLLNWEPIKNKGMKEGYVVKEVDENGRYTRNAYAPEVYYYNGKFYLIVSPGEAAVSPTRGHRVLVADSPEGPFEKYSDQIDAKIDGTVLIDDDEHILFFHATPKGITVHRFHDFKAFTQGDIIPASDGTGAWTEGPGICKIRGWYYLTYTGCHYQTPGYQVLYAVTDKIDYYNDFNISRSFIRGANNPILLNCDKDEGHVGLGHSINFMGPDMDSYYICYHNLDALFEDGMTHRSFNIDRLLVNHGFMTGTSNKEGGIYPKFPFFSSYSLNEGFEKVDSFYLSTLESKQRFTAEFNVKEGENTDVVFSYVDKENYMLIRPDYENRKIYLIKVAAGTETIVEEGSLAVDYSYKHNQTFRVAYDGTLNVYFNNMLKITTKIDLAKGKVGYLVKGNVPLVGYTAISDEANGSSDCSEIKQILGEIPAVLHLKDNAYGDFVPFKLTKEEPVTVVGGVGEYNYTEQLNLNKGDFVRYPVNVKEDGYYGLNVILNKQHLGKKVAIALDDEEYKTFELPAKFDVEDDVVRVMVRYGKLTKGVHMISIKCVEDEFSLVSFSFAKITEKETFVNDLSSNADGITFVREGYQYSKEDKELQVSGKRAFASFTSQLVKDFELNVDMKIMPSETNAPVGIIFRQDNYAPHEVPGQNFIDFNTHIQGYFLELGLEKISISKYNFGNTKSYIIKEEPFSGELNKYYKVKIIVVDNTIKVFVDDKLAIETNVSTGFTRGAVGLYSIWGSGAYKNIDFKTL